MHRNVSVKQAEDAVLLDSSELNIDVEVVLYDRKSAKRRNSMKRLIVAKSAGFCFWRKAGGGYCI